jgi:hypothetical protein
MKKILLSIGILFYCILGKSQTIYQKAGWLTVGGGYSNYNILDKKLDGLNIWLEHENIQIHYSQTINNEYNRDSAYHYLLNPLTSTIKPNSSFCTSRNIGISYRFYKKNTTNLILGVGVQSNQIFHFTDKPIHMDYENEYLPYLNIGASIDLFDRITLQIQDNYTVNFGPKNNVFSIGVGYIFYYW